MLLKNGIEDINTEDIEQITLAKDELKSLYDLNVKVSTDDYTNLPEGRAWVHQMWSGSAISAQWYLPEGTGADALGFWFPEDGAGTIGNDNIAIPRNAKNPVLAHHFLNYLLDNKHGYDNFSNYVGYQPPFTRLDPDRLVKDGSRAGEPEDRHRPRVGLRRGLLPHGADSVRPDGMAERLGRVQGGCLTPTAR